MAADLKQLHEYLWVIEKQLIAGNATEHTHRPALKMLVEGLVKGVIATNEPSEPNAVLLTSWLPKGLSRLATSRLRTLVRAWMKPKSWSS